jgi:sec-independent protein translocase protein TatC
MLPAYNSRRGQTDEEKRMELTEHLGELRSRLIRSMFYVVIGGIISYRYFKPIYAFLFSPMISAMTERHQEYKIVFRHLMEPFTVVLQISLVVGLLMVFPLVTMEAWGFLAPALTKSEKKPLRWIGPLSVCLFVAGAGLGFWISRFAIGFFVSFVTLFPNGELYQDPKLYVMFMLKLMGATGVMFQLPVVCSFLAWVGILKSKMMIKSWRTAIVGMSIGVVVINPAPDLFTMMLMLLPMVALFFFSILMVRMVEKKRAQNMRDLEEED